VADGHFELLIYTKTSIGTSWSWSYGSWIYSYLCNQSLSPLTLWVRISIRRGVLDTTLCDEVCQWLAAGRWFSTGIPVSSTNKIDRHDITEILLKVALNTINHTIPNQTESWIYSRKSWNGCIYIYIYMLPLNYAILDYHSIELLCFRYNESAGVSFLLQQCIALNDFSEGHSYY
jgi:hypothetical protein